MKLKFKKLHSHAVLPSKANKGDAGFDITAIFFREDEYGNDIYSTGLAVEIPDGYVGLIFPRSSIYKKGQFLTNHVGVIDSGYRGEIIFKFKRMYLRADTYNINDRIGQLLIIKLDDFEPAFVDELDQTNDRGGGFGSSGQ